MIRRSRPADLNRLAQTPAYGRIVIDDEDDPGIGGHGHRARSSRRHHDTLACCGSVNWNVAPATVIARGPNPAAMRLDNRPADRQAHSHAAGLCRVERLEQPVQIACRKPGAQVAHRYQHAIGSVSLCADAEMTMSADVRHCLDGIEDEIEDNLLHLDSVPVDRRDLGAELGLQCDIGALQLGPHEGYHLDDELVDVEHLPPRQGLPGERTDSVDDFAGPLPVLDDAFQRLPCLRHIRRSCFKPSHRGFGISDHARDGLVDFVHDGRRQFAHGRDPVCVRKVGLRFMQGRQCRPVLKRKVGRDQDRRDADGAVDEPGAARKVFTREKIAQDRQPDARERDNQDALTFKDSDDDQYDRYVEDGNCDFQLRDGVGDEDRGRDGHRGNEEHRRGSWALGRRRQRHRFLTGLEREIHLSSPVLQYGRTRYSLAFSAIRSPVHHTGPLHFNRHVGQVGKLG